MKGIIGTRSRWSLISCQYHQDYPTGAATCKARHVCRCCRESYLKKISQVTLRSVLPRQKGAEENWKEESSSSTPVPTHYGSSRWVQHNVVWDGIAQTDFVNLFFKGSSQSAVATGLKRSGACASLDLPCMFERSPIDPELRHLIRTCLFWRWYFRVSSTRATCLGKIDLPTRVGTGVQHAKHV